jgi:hypothetical protein
VAKIESLAADPVWVIRTPESEAIAARLWKQNKDVTVFNASDDPEETLRDILFEVDLHHGGMGGFPPIARLEVVGTEASTGVRQILSKIGLPYVSPLSGGFAASRDEL